mgnify:CR=1 FL=1
MIAILAGYIVTYFFSLPTAIASCSLPAVLAHPEQEFGEKKVPLSVQDRCIGLNVDIHVAGGFAMFMAVVLGLLHIAALAVRVWGCIKFEHGGAVGPCADGVDMVEGGIKDNEASTRSSTAGPSFRSSSTLYSTPTKKSKSHANTTSSTAERRNANSIGTEERSTGVQFVDWSVERAERTARRRTVRTDENEASKGGSEWSEILLECLIDA